MNGGKQYNGTIRNLLDAKHRKQMGPAIRLFEWLVSCQTGYTPDGYWGVVLYGRPIQQDHIQRSMGTPLRTIQLWFKRLKDHKYIRVRQASHGVVIWIAKQKKFRPSSVRSSRFKDDSSVPVENPVENYKNGKVKAKRGPQKLADHPDFKNVADMDDNSLHALALEEYKAKNERSAKTCGPAIADNIDNKQKTKCVTREVRNPYLKLLNTNTLNKDAAAETAAVSPPSEQISNSTAKTEPENRRLEPSEVLTPKLDAAVTDEQRRNLLPLAVQALAGKHAFGQHVVLHDLSDADYNRKRNEQLQALERRFPGVKLCN